jgi:voltage-gated potassium channel
MQLRVLRPGSLRERVYGVMFRTETPAGLWFQSLLLVAIAASVLLVMCETVHELRHKHAAAMKGAELGFTVLFSCEYLLRCAVTQPTTRFICSFFGLVDLISILPTLLLEVFPPEPGRPGQEWRSIRIVRVLRLLRIFRVLSLPGLASEADVLWEALYSARRKVVIFFTALFTIVTCVGTLMYLIEDGKAGFTSIPRSIYWAIVTVTTVGYGDITPASVPGQIISCLMMILGYSILAVPTIFASAARSVQAAQVSPRGLRRARSLVGTSAPEWDPAWRPPPAAVSPGASNDPRAIEPRSDSDSDVDLASTGERAPPTAAGETDTLSEIAIAMSRAKRGLGPTVSVLSVTCAQCDLVLGHDADSRFCRFCGAALTELIE